jgi:CheY-like chemotaxis protein
MSPRVVLVIEDNPTTRKIVRLTLGNEGFTVVEADNGAEALALASKTAPDLILQDLLLPDMDGFELVSRLRGLPELAGVPIIAFSGFLSRLEHGRAAGMGFTDLIPKPVEASRLVQVVRAHLPPDVVTPELIGRGQHVLVVDDDPLQLKLARIRLMVLGFEVATATDGAEALEVLQRGSTQAVVSDVLMPRLDGFSLCAAMRKDPRLSRVPLVLVSSNYVEDADRRLARSMGATAFVVRTPDLAGVIQALNTAMTAPPDRPIANVRPDPAEHHRHHERVLTAARAPGGPQRHLCAPVGDARVDDVDRRRHFRVADEAPLRRRRGPRHPREPARRERGLGGCPLHQRCTRRRAVHHGAG